MSYRVTGGISPENMDSELLCILANWLPGAPALDIVELTREVQEYAQNQYTQYEDYEYAINAFAWIERQFGKYAQIDSALMAEYVKENFPDLSATAIAAIMWAVEQDCLRQEPKHAPRSTGADKDEDEDEDEDEESESESEDEGKHDPNCPGPGCQESTGYVRSNASGSPWYIVGDDDLLPGEGY